MTPSKSIDSLSNMQCRRAPVRLLRLALIAALAAAVAGSGAGCRAPASPTPATNVSTVPVAVTPVEWSRATAPVEAAMTLARLGQTELAFKIAGVIEAVTVREGDPVGAGQVLARLKPDEIDAEVARAREAVDKCDRDAARAGRLLADKVATMEQAQNAETALQQARAALSAAEFNARHARITAPANGRVQRRYAEPHQTVSPGVPVLSFAPDEPGWIAHGGLSQADLAAVELGGAVEFEASGVRGAFRGSIWRIAGAADPQTGTADVEVLLNAPPADSRAGYAVHARIARRLAAPRPFVPAAALVEGDGDRAFVFVAEQGFARRQSVQVEAWVGPFARLATPLPEGLAVITSGAERLRDGAAVRLAPVP